MRSSDVFASVHQRICYLVARGTGCSDCLLLAASSSRVSHLLAPLDFSFLITKKGAIISIKFFFSTVIIRRKGATWGQICMGFMMTNGLSPISCLLPPSYCQADWCQKEVVLFATERSENRKAGSLGSRRASPIWLTVSQELYFTYCGQFWCFLMKGLLEASPDTAPAVLVCHESSCWDWHPHGCLS